MVQNANIKTIYGEPIASGNKTVIPVAVSLGDSAVASGEMASTHRKGTGMKVLVAAAAWQLSRLVLSRSRRRQLASSALVAPSDWLVLLFSVCCSECGSVENAPDLSS